MVSHGGGEFADRGGFGLHPGSCSGIRGKLHESDRGQFA
jgi:hypothetical protein